MSESKCYICEAEAEGSYCESCGNPVCENCFSLEDSNKCQECFDETQEEISVERDDSQEEDYSNYESMMDVHRNSKEILKLDSNEIGITIISEDMLLITIFGVYAETISVERVSKQALKEVLEGVGL